jgi:hypothetical protein
MRPVNETVISRFIDQPESTDFDHLAREVAARQLQNGIVSSDLAGAELSTKELDSWVSVPAIPAKRTGEVGTLPANEGLMDYVLGAYWRLLAPAPGIPLLLLATSHNGPAADGLRRAVEHESSPGDLTHPVTDDKVDNLSVRSWLAGRQRGGQPAALVVSGPLIGRLANFLERRRLIFRLPSGSQLITVDSSAAHMKTSETTSLVDRLGLPAGAVRHIVTLPSLTTPLQIVPGHETSELHLAPPPHWARYRLDSDELAMIDLATTELPACQLTGLRATRVGDDGESLVLQP